MISRSCVVVDYGIGNVFSVMKALQKSGANVELTSNRAKILAADRLILPGVGAFGRAIDTLRAMGLDETLHSFIEKGRPFLGICVGMQLLMEEGLEFGQHKGLGVFRGKVTKIDISDAEGKKLRVPLIGWNTPVPPDPGRWKCTPFAALPMPTDFYFVHSFAVQVDDPKDIAAEVAVGSCRLTAAIQKDNIHGVQFHPEKSARGGQVFLDSFMTL